MTITLAAKLREQNFGRPQCLHGLIENIQPPGDSAPKAELFTLTLGGFVVPFLRLSHHPVYSNYSVSH